MKYTAKSSAENVDTPETAPTRSWYGVYTYGGMYELAYEPGVGYYWKQIEGGDA